MTFRGFFLMTFCEYVLKRPAGLNVWCHPVEFCSPPGQFEPARSFRSHGAWASLRTVMYSTSRAQHTTHTIHPALGGRSNPRLAAGLWSATHNESLPSREPDEFPTTTPTGPPRHACRGLASSRGHTLHARHMHTHHQTTRSHRVTWVVGARPLTRRPRRRCRARRRPWACC